MRERETVIFVEVKTRRDREYADPEDAITATKLKRLMRAVRWFLHHKRWDDRPCRFDVVTVILPPESDPEIEHFADIPVPGRGTP